MLNYLARNFYNLRFLALFVCFAINFILLFYKVAGEDTDDENRWGGDAEDDEDTFFDMDEFVLQESTGYMLPTLRFLGLFHTIISLLCLVGYYCLKVPVVVFKREKEIARQIEFDGLYITEQPSDDDIKGQWDRLVVPPITTGTSSSSVRTPVLWVARSASPGCGPQVINKYGDLYGAERIAELLGLDKSALDFDPTVETVEKEASLVSWLSSIDTKYHTWKLGVVLTDNNFLYLIWYTTMSIFGHFNNFFFAAHLLDIAMGFKTLRTILSSVTHNGKQLVLTVGLLAVVVYLYTVVAFNFFRKFYNKSEDEDEPDMKCDDMMTVGGALRDFRNPSDTNGSSSEDVRAAGGRSDLCCRFLGSAICSTCTWASELEVASEMSWRTRQETPTSSTASCSTSPSSSSSSSSCWPSSRTKCFICGIGNDYFDRTPHGFETHTLQEHNLANYLFFLMYLINKDETEHTGQTKCFICGIGNDYFDRTPHGFETHTLQEHNLANYLFFLMYLINKDETEHTGQESYVWKMYQERCWDFFPTGDCFRKQYEDQL
ncbi:unnamed protein product, partial [Tetraodon nigroviridis]